MLTQERVRELFTYHPLGYLIWNGGRNKNKPAGTTGTHKRYIYIKIGHSKYPAHRLIYVYHFGTNPAYVDHINRDGMDNRIENLRAATVQQNMANQRKRRQTSSRWKGVSFNKKKRRWYAWIQANGVKKFLGMFKDEADAALAYNFAALELHGEFAVLNEALQV